MHLDVEEEEEKIRTASAFLVRGCWLSYQLNVCTHRCTKPLSGQLWTQKWTYPLAGIHSYEKIPFFKAGDGQSIARIASPAYKTSAVLFAAISVHSTPFTPDRSKHYREAKQRTVITSWSVTSLRQYIIDSTVHSTDLNARANCTLTVATKYLST